MTRVESFDGVPVSVLAERVGVPLLALYDAVGSALDVAHTLAADGAPDGTLVLADRQDAGRGRQGRAWVSPAGTGVWLAMVRRTAATPASGVLALRVGLALVETMEDLGVSVGLKWPNDVLLADGKLAGILCEARSAPGVGHWVAVGVGINVTGAAPAPGAAVLATTVPEADRLGVLAVLVPRLARLGLGSALTEVEQRAWAAHDWLRGRELTAPMPGQAAGIAADGALLVATPDGTRRILGGTVTCSSQ